MKKKWFLLLFVFSLCCPIYTSYSQTKPWIGELNDVAFPIHIKECHIILPVNDGDDNTQDLSFNVSSSDTSILALDAIEYQTGSLVAVIKLHEKNTLGDVNLRIDISDEDGSTSTEIKASVVRNHKGGILFEIHDLVFWKEADPINNLPVWDTVISTSEAPYDDIQWDEVPLTVNQDCVIDICTGHDFFTAHFKGYIIPPYTGDYVFYMSASNDMSLKISSNEDFGNLSEIIYKGDKKSNIGINTGSNEYKSSPVTLKANSVYAISGVNWIVLSTLSGLKWEGPGILKQFVQKEHMSYVYAPDYPNVSCAVIVEKLSSDKAILNIIADGDIEQISGYNIYINGTKINDDKYTSTEITVDNLTLGHIYSVIATVLDKPENEIAVSNIETFATFNFDNKPPLPPENVSINTIGSLAAEISWESTTDNETGIWGYTIYVNGLKYNKTYIQNNTGIVTGLNPQTSYTIELSAVDVFYNESEKSSPVSFNTNEFNIDGPDLGVKKGKFHIQIDTIAYNTGFGIQGEYKTGAIIDDANQNKLVKELEPSIVRWGAITANSLSLSDFSGPDKNMTYAKWVQFAIDNNAYCAITCGVQNETDWMKDPATFTNFLEYIAGPASTTWGSIREKEGYSEPLLPKCKGLLFEFGNEVWGGPGLHKAEIGVDYIKYGKWCKEMATLMRNSPYFDPVKIKFAYSGRNPSPDRSYGLNTKVISGDNGEIDIIALSGYLGGNLNYDPEIPFGKSELDYYKSSMGFFAEYINGLDETAQNSIELIDWALPSYFYETNMTTSSYNGRLGQALILSDYLLTAMEHGGIYPVIFALTGGQWKIIQPANGYKTLPLYEIAKLINIKSKGEILHNELVTSGSLSLPSGASLNIEPVGCHVITNNNSYVMVLFSRDFEHDYFIEVNLPDELKQAQFSSGKIYSVSGSDYSTFDAIIDSAEIIVHDKMIVKIPKHTMVMITFDNTDSATTAINSDLFQDNTNVGPQIVISPNPTSEKLKITSQVSHLQKITLTDIFGRIVKVYDQVHQKELIIDISDLKKGAYIVNFPLRKNKNSFLVQMLKVYF